MKSITNANSDDLHPNNLAANYPAVIIGPYKLVVLGGSIPWWDLRGTLSDEHYGNLQSWMHGQTLSGDGPYVYDVQRWWSGIEKGKPAIPFD